MAAARSGRSASASEKPTMSAPAPLRKSRRAKAFGKSMFMAVSSRFRGAFHGAHDSEVRAAAAEIVLQRVLDFGDAGFGIGFQKRRGLHDHAVDAITALHRLFFDEGGLQFVRLLLRPQSFERDDLVAR